jgi:hypothetical protein
MAKSEPLRRAIRCVRVGHGIAPFNLYFSGKLTVGTGIYLIQFDDEIVYVGEYRPLERNIVEHRWKRHLQTITARGLNIGFNGESNSKKRLQDLQRACVHPRLQAALKRLHDKEERRFAHFKDTGYNTSENRLRFAGMEWDYFASVEPEQIMDRFKFHHISIRRPRNQVQAKAEIDKIERLILGRIQPLCNDEYRHEKSGRPISRSRAVRVVNATICDVTGVRPVSHLVLDGSQSDSDDSVPAK